MYGSVRKYSVDAQESMRSSPIPVLGRVWPETPLRRGFPADSSRV